MLPQGKPLSPLRKEREKPSDLHLICLLQRECSLTLSPRFMYQYWFSSAGRGNERGAMPFLMSFALEPEIVTLAWIDNVPVQFPLNIYATKG